MEIDMSHQAWQRWWDFEGSEMRPHPSGNAEEFARSITKIAWENGAYKCLADVERLRAELAAMRQQRDEARELYCRQIAYGAGRLTGVSDPRKIASIRGWEGLFEGGGA